MSAAKTTATHFHSRMRRETLMLKEHGQEAAPIQFCARVYLKTQGLSAHGFVIPLFIRLGSCKLSMSCLISEISSWMQVTSCIIFAVSCSENAPPSVTRLGLRTGSKKQCVVVRSSCRRRRHCRWLGGKTGHVVVVVVVGGGGDCGCGCGCGCGCACYCCWLLFVVSGLLFVV